MRDVRDVIGGLVVLCVASGCRTATRIIEEPRVDLELSGGNRGYLVGNLPPASEPQKTMRQMVETEIEMPPLSRSAPAALPAVAVSEEEIESGQDQPQTFDTYVVQKGETLWSIAANPNVYGDATEWRKLFSANREVLNSPDQLRAGMTLRVPRQGGSTREPTGEAQGTTTSTK